MNQIVNIVAQPRLGEKPFGLQGYYFESLNSIFYQYNLKPIFHEFDAHKGIRLRSWLIERDSWVKAPDIVIDGVVYDRIVTNSEKDQKIVTEYLERHLRLGGTVTNSIEITNLCQDKVLFYQFCEGHGFASVPHFGRIEDLSSDRIKEPLLYKPRYGFGGSGFFYQDQHGVVRPVDGTDNGLSFGESSSSNNDFIISPIVECLKIRGRPFDLRVFVQRATETSPPVATASVIRLGGEGGIVSNLSKSGLALPVELACSDLTPTDKERFEEGHKNALSLCEDISSKFLEVGDFAEIGFDVLFTLDFQPIVLEANSKPARWAFEQIARDASYNDGLRSIYSAHRTHLMNNLASYFSSLT